MDMTFHKMHGLGNDFVLIDVRGNGRFDAARVPMLADRHRGIGCDQILVLEDSLKADALMRIYNPDGSKAGACGNGARCAARLVMNASKRNACSIEAGPRLLACRDVDGRVEVDMGAPLFGWRDVPLVREADSANLIVRDDLPPAMAVNMGNPHVVFFVNDVTAIDVAAIGPEIERHPLFPERANVEFAQVLGRDRIRMRVWERGAGITQACGSGACATAVAAMTRNLSDKGVVIELDGGELTVQWNGPDGHVLMTGPATYVFDGRVAV